MKVLFATDGSVNAENARQSVMERQWPEETRFHIITVAEPLEGKLLAHIMKLDELVKKARTALMEDAKQLLQTVSAELKGKFGEDKVTTELVEGNPKQEIVGAAQRWGADLIVIGSHGTSELDEQWFGSVTRAVLSEAPCTVQVLNPLTARSFGKKANNMQPAEESRYLVAVSDEQNAAVITDAIMSRPWSPSALFQVVSIIYPLAHYEKMKIFKRREIVEYAEKAYAASKQGAKELVEKTARKLETKFRDDQVTFHVLEGNPRSMILQLAQDWPADMIIMGSHDKKGNIVEHLLGSTATAVVWNAPCSVELVKLVPVAVSR